MSPGKINGASFVIPSCQLCSDLHDEYREATRHVLVPMAGYRKRYWLCEEHAAEIDAYVEEG